MAGLPQVVADARDKGPDFLEKLLRDTEAGTDGVAATRFKRADDAAAVW